MSNKERIEKRTNGTKGMGRLILFSLLFFLCSFAFSYDFGLILDNTAGIGGNGGKNAGDKNAGDKNAFDYSGILVPRFQSFWGENLELYVSAGIEACYVNKEFYVVPELLRTELSYSFGRGDVKAGRIHYSDPLGYIANGLFDGTRFSYNSALGVFGAGAWYTGFLYKSRADITMTAKEKENYNAKLDYSDFAKTYFAPSRMIAALDWEHSNLLNLLMAKAALLGQFDLSGENLNCQYLVVSAALPLRAFLFDLGGCLELIQNECFGAAFSADLGATWMLPVSLQSRLSFFARYTSGSSTSIDAFLPVTTKSQGFVLKANHSGITLLSLDYAARLHSTCSLAFSSSYFIRNDKTTYAGFGEDGSLLGNEFFGRLLWSPVSDMRFNLGAGLFLPSMGNVAPRAKSLWRVELNFVMSLY